MKNSNAFKYAMFSLVWPSVVWLLSWLLMVSDRLFDYVKSEHAIPFGILILLLPVIAGYVGTLYGIIALREYSKTNSKDNGKKLAICGVFVWWVVFILYLLLNFS
jgi:hypothetical protein